MTRKNMATKRKRRKARKERNADIQHLKKNEMIAQRNIKKQGYSWGQWDQTNVPME